MPEGELQRGQIIEGLGTLVQRNNSESAVKLCVEEKRMANGSQKQTIVFGLGVALAVTGLLVNVAVLAAALYGSEMFSSNVFNTLFLGIVLGVAGYVLGARKLGIAAVVVTVAATLVGAVLEQWVP
jgi:hypothetical protein